MGSRPSFLKPCSRARPLGLGAVVLTAAALLAPAASAMAAAAPMGSGKTVAFGLTRSGSAGVTAGTCGSRLQCFKDGINEATAATTPLVEQSALVMINVAEPDQDVNLKLSGKQLLIAPDADPSGNGKPDYVDAVNKISLGGGTCYVCALQGVDRAFDSGARAGSEKVIVLVSERENTFNSTGYTSSGLPTGYPPATFADMVDQFDSNTVIRAFAVGPQTSCTHDPNGIGSLADTAAVTPGGTCTNVASFENLGPLLTEAVAGGGPLPPPDTTPPAVTLTSPADGASFLETEPHFIGAAGTATGDDPSVTVKVWQGTDTSVAPLQTRVASVSSGGYEITAAPPLTPVTYSAQAEQVDAARNIGRSTLISFTVLEPAPPPPSDGHSYAETVREDSPAGYWRLGDLSGTIATEDQARANGTYLNGVLLGIAPAINDANMAARFDGGNDKVAIPDPANGSLDFGTGDFTAEAWVKPSASDERVIVSKRSGVTTEPYWSLTVTDDSNHNGQVRAVYFDGTNTRTAYSSKGLLDGLWHHVVVTFDRDTGITISVDGVVKSTALAIAPDVSNTGEIQIGKGAANPYFKGDIDEVALYPSLISTQRIAAHATAAAGS